MNNLHLYNELYKVLRMEDHFCTATGELIKSNIETAALNLNPELIRLLLNNELLSRHFFADVDGVKVFDKVKFQRFIMNKQFLPDSYTSFKNKIGLTTDDGRFITDSREVVLSWPFKDCMLEGGQTKEDAKRDEVFWNETLAPDEINRLTEPKAFTSFKRYDKDGEHEVDHLLPNDNLIIKGNNLLALYSLKEKYAGRVKLIYIDPPYNTGSDDFGYNDNFNHSTWLTFMKNRLEAASELLRNDGFIFVQCDDSEQAYLKVLMDGVFGRENHINTICVKMSHLSGMKMSHKDKKLPKLQETIHMYSKSPSVKLNEYFIPGAWDNVFERYTKFVERNSDDCSTWEIKTLKQKLKECGLSSNTEIENFCIENADCIFRTAVNDSFKNEEKRPYFTKIVSATGLDKYMLNKEEVIFAETKIKVFEGKKQPAESIGDIWTDIGINNLHNEGGVQLPNGKKPEKLIERIISLTTQTGDIVLDFFGGSGTTGAVSHKMNRQYIMCEQMEHQIELQLRRLPNVINGESSGISKAVNWQGGGSFVYCELFKANQNFVEQIEAATTKEALATIWQQMQQTGFLSYKIKAKDIDDNAETFDALSLDDQKRFLIECLDKNLLYVPLSDIDNADYNVSEKDKRLTREFYKKGV